MIKLPLSVAVKNFLGLYVLTPFEQRLLASLKEALAQAEKEVLEFQLAHYTTVRRLIRHIDVPNAHGYTNFYTLRLGSDITDKVQTKRFSSNKVHSVIATARIAHSGGEINVKFILVRDVLFRIEYRSRQKIYYPSGEYQVHSFDLWPTMQA